jgi:4-alpha-glucanotransferase
MSLSRFASGRHAGLLVPLFSMPSTASWGIGEFGDLRFAAAWMREAGQDLLLLLPINEMAPDQDSPYAAISAMALDPIFISLEEVPDFRGDVRERIWRGTARRDVAVARASRAIAYRPVRRAKRACLRAAFSRFMVEEWSRGGDRARALSAYVEAEAWWLDDYALFRAIREQPEIAGRPWWTWPEDLRQRRPEALERERRRLQESILLFQYLQWIAEQQWREARAGAAPVGIFGDFPFMVGPDSADVWVRQDEFLLEASVGTPPDAFSETGQNWGLPVYRWDVMAANDFAWLRQRARRSAALYDGYRVDHLVGFYRTYVRPSGDVPPFFTPALEADQLALGEALLRMFLASGPAIIAEDLGTIPDFVRASLGRLQVPGYRVLRWEREWERPGQPFLDPATYPPLSVATSGTHDTPPLAAWWDDATDEERRAFTAIPAMRHLAAAASGPYGSELRDAILAALYGSGSNLVILPIQDVFGWRDQINVPASTSRKNWTYRLPWPIDRWGEQEQARDAAERLRSLAAAHAEGGRGQGPEGAPAR